MTPSNVEQQNEAIRLWIAQLISKITDRMIEDLTDWANRPLDRVYPAGGRKYNFSFGTVYVGGVTIDSFEDGRYGWAYSDGYKIRWHTHSSWFSSPNLDGKVCCARVITP